MIESDLLAAGRRIMIVVSGVGLFLGGTVISALCALLALFAPMESQAGSVPARLKQDTECMLKVLKSVPGVREAKLGKTTSSGQKTLPYLEYRAAETTHWTSPTRFVARRSDDGSFWFLASLPGIVPTSGRLDLHVTDVVVEKWKNQCGVEATVIVN